MTTARRAGVGRLADGHVVTWSVADGRRGRRWRSATTNPGGALESVLLLELTPDGAVSKVELATATGLLTLHPEAGTLHGNVVAEGGVRHVRLPWSPAHVLVIVGSVVSLGAVVAQAAPGGVGERHLAPAVVVQRDLEVGPAVVGFERVSRSGVRVQVGARVTEIELDELGVPNELGSGGWPLELD